MSTIQIYSHSATYVSYDMPDRNYSNQCELKVGSCHTPIDHGYSIDLFRTLMKFDLNDLPNCGIKIKQALLVFDIEKFCIIPCSSHTNLFVCKNMEDYCADSVTWNTAPGYLMGGEHAIVESIPSNVPMDPSHKNNVYHHTIWDGGTIELDVTELVQQWSGDRRSNYGISLLVQPENAYLEVVNRGWHECCPQLIIEYERIPVPKDNCSQYHSKPFGYSY